MRNVHALKPRVQSVIQVGDSRISGIDFKSMKVKVGRCPRFAELDVLIAEEDRKYREMEARAAERRAEAAEALREQAAVDEWPWPWPLPAALPAIEPEPCFGADENYGS